jgi:peptide/nickel transport system substrate-binding protein
MNGRTRNIDRKALCLWAAGVLFFCLFQAVPEIARAQERSRKINGFDVSGRFLGQWSAAGSDRDSLYVNGLPITARRPEISLTDGKTYDTQWFERASYEYHPENKPPYDVMLGLLGSRLVEGRGSVDLTTGQLRDKADASFLGVDQPAGTSGTPGQLWFPETRHTLAGTFLDTWNRYGGLQQFGFPISERFQEQSPDDGKPYTVQYFERARFELHPDKPAPYDVELGLLGTQQYRLQAIAGDDLPIAPAPGIASAKDTYVEGSSQEPDTLLCNEGNPAATRFCAAITFGDSLVGVDNNDAYFPLAAWYVPTIENGGSYFVGSGNDRHLVTKYKLRRGLKWSDGADLTSTDAVFSFGLIADDPHSASPDLQRHIHNVVAPDKYTVIYNWLSNNQARAILGNPTLDQNLYDFLRVSVRMNRPMMDPRYLQIGTIHPQHTLANMPPDQLHDSAYAHAPIGYGPYKLQEWKRGEQMVLVQNDYYTLTQKPPLKRIVVKFNLTQADSISAMLAGDLDGIAGFQLTPQPDQTDQIRSAGDVVAVVPSATWEQIGFQFTFGPFRDLAVRQAIIYGINRKRILDVAFHGAGALLDTPVPAFIYHSLANPNFALDFPDLAAKYQLPHYDYDPAKANAILDAAGWARGPDGIRAKNGFRLSFEYATTDKSVRKSVQTLVAEDLKQLGIDALTKNYDAGTFFDPGGIRWKGICKLCEFAYATTPTANFDQWEHINYVTEPPANLPDWSQYANDRVTSANEIIKVSTDRHEIAQQSAIIQTEVMKDVAIIPLVQWPNIEIYSGKMRGRKTVPDITSQWWNISQWYFVP